MGTYVWCVAKGTKAAIGDRAPPSAFSWRGMIQEAEQITHAWKESPVARIQPAEVLLVTDFDGTLAESVQDPAGARATPDALAAIHNLVPLLADMLALSSRPPAPLESLIPKCDVSLTGDSARDAPRPAAKEAGG